MTWSNYIFMPPSLVYVGTSKGIADFTNAKRQQSSIDGKSGGFELPTYDAEGGIGITGDKSATYTDDYVISSPLQQTTDKSGSGHETSNHHHHQQQQHPDEPAITWKQLIQQNQALYDFACFTGVVYPIANNSNNGEKGQLSSSALLRRQMGCIAINVMVYLYIFASIGATLSYHRKDPWSMTLFNGDIVIKVLLMIVMIISTAQLRFQIASNGIITKRLASSFTVDVNKIINDAVTTGLAKTWYMIYILTVISLVFSAVQFSHLHYIKSHFGRFMNGFGSVMTGLVYAFFVGSQGFIIIEQKISLLLALQVQSMIVNETLYDTFYLMIGEDMKERDRSSPLDLVLTMTSVSSIIGISLILDAIFDNALSTRFISLFVAYCGIMVAREITILLFLLHSMLQVNGVVDGLIEKMPSPLVSRQLLLEGESKLLLLPSNEESFQRFRRVELLVTLREFTIGTTVWSWYRPTKLQLVIEITSIVTLVATSILRFIVINISASV